ncbi:uncharacterized protein [Euphorbia lathyris]|uniref:uncharacterized protein n=1 Tax=Euphorbia lathyris TaxID=212925 RepID=UPI003313733D
MGVDAKRIQVCVLRLVKFSFNISSKFVKNHPLISCVSLFLFIFYFFLPKAFFLLIYSCPFLSCTYVFIRFYRHSQGKYAGKKPDAGQPKLTRKDGKSVRRTHTRSSSSRNMELKSREAVSEETKSNIADATTTTTTTTTEEKVDSLLASACEKIGELKSDLKSKSDFGGKVETEISTSEDEEAKETRNKAVEWNEDDQKNLMDLGLSELERNKRLESLIARRRARKLNKAQTDKNLLSSINSSNPFLVAPVSIARSNTFDVPNAPDLLIPGSAPSILLQRNPFDLPYDPFEEKPNLMADSFQQEFMEAHQKEMLFCRHESFTLGSFYPFPNSHNDRDIAGRSGFKRRQDQGDSDRVVQPIQLEGGGTLNHSLSATDLVTENTENSQSEELEEATSSTIENKGKAIENSEMESSIDEGSEAQIEMEAKNESSSSLPQKDEQAARAKNATNLTHLTTPIFRFPESSAPSSGPCPLPRARTVNEINYLASPATIDRSTLENHLLYTNSGPWHTPNDSIASDMQVEVSEVGSPPLTGDGSASSNDGDSLTYDGDAEKEITSGSDEMWGVSPHAPRGEEHNLTSREVNELSNDLISRDFSVHQKEPEGSIIQLPQQHQTHELQDSVEGTSLLDSSISFTSPQEENLQNLQESMNVSEKSEDEVNINYNLDVPAPAYDELDDEKSVDVTRDLPETSTISENDRDIKSSHEKSVEEVSIAYITDTPAPTFDDTDTEDKKLVQVTCDLPETSTISEVDHEPASEMISESSNHIESKSLSSEVSIGDSTDVPAPNCDILEDLKSVEVTVPETSISEVAHKINSECSHNIESKSLDSPEQAIDEISVAETNDAPVQTYDNLGDQKSVEVASDLPETSIISEISRDLSDMPDEINSGFSNHTESKSLNSLEQAIDEVSVAETIDAPVQTYDDLGDQKSVEVASDLPETSIISEIAGELSELANEINSGFSNRSESKSLNSPEQAIDEVRAAETIDAPVQTYDDLGDQKSVEVASDLPETSIISEIARDPADLADEINSGSSNHTKRKSLNSPKKAIEEVSITDTIDAPDNTFDDQVTQLSRKQKSVVAGNDVPYNQAVADRAIPTEEAEQSIIEENFNEGKESFIPSEDVKDKHSMSEVDISGINQNCNGSSTSGTQQGSMVEQVFSSQKSVSPVVQSSPTSSNLNSHIQTGVSESDMEENIQRAKLLDQKLPQNSALTPAQNEHDEIPVDSEDHPSIERNPQNTEETSNALGTTIDNAREMLHTNEAFIDDEKAKEAPKSRESMHDEAENPISNEAIVEISNLPDKIESRSVEHIEGTSGNQSEYDPSIQQTKPVVMLHTNEALIDDEKAKEDPKSRESMHDEAENPISNEATVELSNLPDEIESRSVDHIEGTSGNQSEYDPSIQQTKPVEKQGELENLTEHRNAVSPSKHAVVGDHLGMSSTVGEQALLQNSTTINETVSNEIISKDQFGFISENEVESQGINKSSHSKEIPKFTEDQDHILESSKDTKSESRKATEDLVVTNQLDQPGGSNNSNDIKNVEHIKSESKDSIENGSESDKVTIIDELKPPSSEAPQD